ncbi:MAG: glycosyltransferase family 4 protein [Bacteriovorax sp.]|nr:glycosyltransferase family 4 protein [Bacteriovorax sp.]
MKIIHVAQFLGIGGLEKIVYHLALEQQRRGHIVEIYIYDYERTWVEYFRKSGLTVITPELKKPGYDLALLQRMNTDLFSADVIHGHDLNPLMYLGPLSIWKKLTFQKRPKLVHTTHGLDHIDNYPRGKIYQKIFARLADAMVGVSEKIGKFYLEDIKLSPEKVVVIPNGISTYDGVVDKQMRDNKKAWIAQRHGLDVNRPVILSLSRIVPLKDQKFLMMALKLRPYYQLIIAGPPSDQAYYDELKTLEDKNIKLIGPQELVLEYNMGSDMYVSASTHEGIPVAVLEAMAVETPCLVSEIPGHITLLKYGSFFKTFTLNDMDGFLKQFDKIFSDLKATHDNAKKARGLVENHYSVKTMVNKYLQVYES